MASKKSRLYNERGSYRFSGKNNENKEKNQFLEQAIITKNILTEKVDGGKLTTNFEESWYEITKQEFENLQNFISNNGNEQNVINLIKDNVDLRNLLADNYLKRFERLKTKLPWEISSEEQKSGTYNWKDNQEIVKPKVGEKYKGSERKINKDISIIDSLELNCRKKSKTRLNRKLLQDGNEETQKQFQGRVNLKLKSLDEKCQYTLRFGEYRKKKDLYICDWLKYNKFVQGHYDTSKPKGILKSKDFYRNTYQLTGVDLLDMFGMQKGCHVTPVESLSRLADVPQYVDKCIQVFMSNKVSSVQITQTTGEETSENIDLFSFEQTFEEQTFDPIEEQTFEPIEEQTLEPIEEQTLEPIEEQTLEPIEEQTVVDSTRLTERNQFDDANVVMDEDFGFESKLEEEEDEEDEEKLREAYLGEEGVDPSEGFPMSIEEVLHILRPEGSRTSMPGFIYDMFENYLEGLELDRKARLEYFPPAEDVEEEISTEKSEKCFIDRIESEHLLKRDLDKKIDKLFSKYGKDEGEICPEFEDMDANKGFYYVCWDVISRRIEQSKKLQTQRVLPHPLKDVSISTSESEPEEYCFIENLKRIIGPRLVKAITMMLILRPKEKPVTLLVKLMKHLKNTEKYEQLMSDVDWYMLDKLDEIFITDNYLPRRFKIPGVDEIGDSTITERTSIFQCDSICLPEGWEPLEVAEKFIQPPTDLRDILYTYPVSSETLIPTPVSEITINTSDFLSNTSGMVIGSSIALGSFLEPSDSDIIYETSTTSHNRNSLMRYKKYPTGYAMDPFVPPPFRLPLPFEEVEPETVSNLISSDDLSE